MRGTALLLVLGCAGSGAIDAGPGRWKLDFKLSLVETEGLWSFHVDGTTDLPAGTLLQARVTVLDVHNDPLKGPVEDDGEPLVGRDDAFQTSSHAFKVEKAEFHERVHAFRRKPYSLSYRAKVTYGPEDQTDALALKVGDEPFGRQADLRVGTAADFAAELRDRVKDMGQDLIRLESLATTLDGWIARAGQEPAAWSAWRDQAAEAVGEIQTRNLHRFKVWAVWAEYQGRMRIDGLSGFLERMMAALDEPKPNANRVRLWMAGFVEAIDEAYTTIGFDPPLDGRKAGPVLVAYERAVRPLLEGKAEQFRRGREEGITALFDMLRLLRSRPRGYSYVAALSQRLAQVLDLLDQHAPAPALREAVVHHEAALRELRQFAGVP
jgi:hypothetical protein